MFVCLSASSGDNVAPGLRCHPALNLQQPKDSSADPQDPVPSADCSQTTLVSQILGSESGGLSNCPLTDLNKSLLKTRLIVGHDHEVHISDLMELNCTDTASPLISSSVPSIVEATGCFSCIFPELHLPAFTPAVDP